MQSAVDQLIDVLVPMRAARLTCAAAGTVLLYDILITTSDEIRFIWPSQFSLPKFLYFMVGCPRFLPRHTDSNICQNRYFPVPCVILGMYCTVIPIYKPLWLTPSPDLAGFREDLSTNVCITLLIGTHL